MNSQIGVDDVAELIRKQLGSKLDRSANLDASADLQALGLSSLDVTEVFFGIEERVGFELDPSGAADVKTIGDLVEVVNTQVAVSGTDGAAPSTPLA